MRRRDAKFPPIVTSPLEDWMVFLDSIEGDLQCYKTKKPVRDLVILSCGCLMSGKEVASQGENFECPVCGDSTKFVKLIDPLQRIYDKIENQRKELELRLLGGTIVPTPRPTTSNLDFGLLNNTNSSTVSSACSSTVDLSNTTKSSSGLIELFKSAAQDISRTDDDGGDGDDDDGHNEGTMGDDRLSTTSPSPKPLTTGSGGGGGVVGSMISGSSAVVGNFASENKSMTPSISSEENPTSITSTTMNSPPATLPNQFSPEFIRREQNYEKCFPLYRKQYQHSTQTRSLLRSNKKSTFSTCISPDATKFAIVNAHKCQIYQIPWDYNNPPTLLTQPPIKDWGESPMISMSNTYLAIANSHGNLWVYDFESSLIYHHTSNFIINCMALSPLDTVIACGIITKNPQTNLKQPVIVLHLFHDKKLISVLIPYCDTLSFLKFSNDDTFLTCSTAAQCRFMVISLINPKNPRLVMKSSRKSDPDEEFEGITSVNFVPYSSHRQYMVVTSTISTNTAPPIILDTKVISSSTSSVTSAVSQPTLLMRVDKVGSKIHSSAASPRGDGIAFLDKSGLVYVMHAPGLLNDHRKICVAAQVAKAPKSSSSASMQFSPSGRVLVIVDRKGDIHIQDYGAGTPQQAGIGKCRLLN